MNDDIKDVLLFTIIVLFTVGFSWIEPCDHIREELRVKRIELRTFSGLQKTEWINEQIRELMDIINNLERELDSCTQQYESE